MGNIFQNSVQICINGKPLRQIRTSCDGERQSTELLGSQIGNVLCKWAADNMQIASYGNCLPSENENDERTGAGNEQLNYSAGSNQVASFIRQGRWESSRWKNKLVLVDELWLRRGCHVILPQHSLICIHREFFENFPKKSSDDLQPFMQIYPYANELAMQSVNFVVFELQIGRCAQFIHGICGHWCGRR